ncbi:MAG: hypothetical protein E7299_06575 [Lachnospiraceae bacterium]|nr:hypothetical protein [Lachnospiraceae bacterium]
MEVIMVLFGYTRFLTLIVLLPVLVLIAAVISHSRKRKNTVQIAQELCGAKLFERFIAYAIDSSIVWIIWCIYAQWFFLWGGFPYEWFEIEEGVYYKFSPDGVLRFVMEEPSRATCHLGVHMSVMLLVVGTFLYFFLSESGKRESSLGKRMVGLCVVRTDGRKARTLDILTRTLLKMFPALLSGLIFMPIVWGMAGVIWIVYILVLLFTKNHTTVYDQISDCMVVRREQREAVCRGIFENRNTLYHAAQLPQRVAVPQQPVPTVTQQPVPTVTQQPVPTVPQQPVPTVTQQQFPTVPQQPVPTMPQQSVDVIPPMIPIEHLKNN